MSEAPMNSPLSPLFRPSRIAVIGASSNPDKMGFQIFRNIKEAGFAGEIVPVNPKGEVILGVPSIRSAAELPEGTDLAVVIIPAKLVPGTMRELGARKVKSAIVITGGFAESGDAGAALQAEMAEAAQAGGIRVVGPNCQGVNYPYHGVCASWPLITRRGEIAIVSQSGTVGAALIDWASEERLGFSAFVSMGNRSDVDEADLIGFFGEDPHTKVVALYIEGVKDAAKFLSAVRACPKPVVIFKAGRTERGRKAAESHTRSLAGRDEIYDAVFRQNGVHRAATLEELYDFAKALAYVPPPKGPRTLIVTSSGGSAIIATDVAEEEGLRVTPLSPALSRKLREILPSHCIVGNPLDLTGDTDAARYRSVLDAADGEYDVVMTIFGDPIPGASEVIRPGRCELVAYLGGADVEREERVRFHEKKIAVFPTPERAVKALSCHVRFHRGRFPLAAQQTAHASKVPARAISPADSMQLLARAGFPLTRFRRAGGALVCAMAPAGQEVIVGVTRDQQFGHAVMFGLGGIFVEVMKDVSFRVAPLSERDAAEMVSEIRGYRALTGLRGKPPADLGALRALLRQVSAFLASNPQIEEMDLNPVIVHERGLSIADARVVLNA